MAIKRIRSTFGAKPIVLRLDVRFTLLTFLDWKFCISHPCDVSVPRDAAMGRNVAFSVHNFTKLRLKNAVVLLSKIVLYCVSYRTSVPPNQSSNFSTLQLGQTHHNDTRLALLSRRTIRWACIPVLGKIRHGFDRNY